MILVGAMDPESLEDTDGLLSRSEMSMVVRARFGEEMKGEAEAGLDEIGDEVGVGEEGKEVEKKAEIAGVDRCVDVEDGVEEDGAEEGDEEEK